MRSYSGLTQVIEISNVEFSQNKIHISYHLNDTTVGRYYSVRVYSSKDNFLNPLKNISGDAGIEIAPGANKVIVLDAMQEFGIGFNDKVELEVRGRTFVPFINMDGFEDIKTLKRKREYNITWSGGRPQNILNFDLYKGEEKVMTFPNIANVGHYKMQLPKHTKPGKDYRFTVTDIKNKDEAVRTGTFRIKRKIPLAMKVISAFAVAGAAQYLLTNLRSSEGNFIPDPISPN